MVTILREADTKPVPDVAKKHGVSGQTIYSWRKHFGSLEPSDVKRLRQLEQENGCLKKIRGISIASRRSRENNGRRTRAPAVPRSRGLSDRRDDAPRALGGTVGVGLPVDDGRAGGAGMTVWRPSTRATGIVDSDFPSTGPCDEPRSGPSTLASRDASGRHQCRWPTVRNHVIGTFLRRRRFNWSRGLRV